MVSLILLRKTIDVSIIDGNFVKNVAIVVLCSWGPLQLIKLFRVKFDPTENEKVMRDIKVEAKKQEDESKQAAATAAAEAAAEKAQAQAVAQ